MARVLRRLHELGGIRARPTGSHRCRAAVIRERAAQPGGVPAGEGRTGALIRPNSSTFAGARSDLPGRRGGGHPGTMHISFASEIAQL